MSDDETVSHRETVPEERIMTSPKGSKLDVSGLMSKNIQHISASHLDLSSLPGLTAGTTVLMTPDGQHFLIPVALNGEGSLSSGTTIVRQERASSIRSNDSSNLDMDETTGNGSLMSGGRDGNDLDRKRRDRLEKNRQAAKECRRKKKEYIKCLENRVACLENQNKALIEELKSLKELYCKSTNFD